MSRMNCIARIINRPGFNSIRNAAAVADSPAVGASLACWRCRKTALGTRDVPARSTSASWANLDTFWHHPACRVAAAGDRSRFRCCAASINPNRSEKQDQAGSSAVSSCKENDTHNILCVRNMGDSKRHVYDESKIKTLSSLEHIRLRTGMYVGRLGDGSHYDDGCYILLKEVIDNAIDEYIMGHGKEVQVAIDGTNVSVRDYGRGIPLGKVVDCVSKINTGAKYNDEVFQFSVGLNGVGTKAVNALSKQFVVRSHREGEYVEASFKQGKLKNEKKGKVSEPDGTFICFEPDPD